MYMWTVYTKIYVTSNLDYFGDKRKIYVTLEELQKVPSIRLSALEHFMKRWVATYLVTMIDAANLLNLSEIIFYLKAITRLFSIEFDLQRFTMELNYKRALHASKDLRVWTDAEFI